MNRTVFDTLAKNWETDGAACVCLIFFSVSETYALRCVWHTCETNCSDAVHRINFHFFCAWTCSGLLVLVYGPFSCFTFQYCCSVLICLQAASLQVLKLRVHMWCQYVRVGVFTWTFSTFCQEEVNSISKETLWMLAKEYFQDLSNFTRHLPFKNSCRCHFFSFTII